MDDDPWPKFGRDLRNSNYAPRFGPHSMPELRWWAYGGTGGGTGVTFRGGPIVARFGPHGDRGDVRCIVVPGNQQYSPAGSPALYVFRFHPCECYSPNDAPAAPIYTITFGVAGESVHSTPLAIEIEIAEMEPSLRELVIVQSTHRIYCFDFTGLNYENVCTLPPSITTPLWT